jgi:hypothetical protein
MNKHTNNFHQSLVEKATANQLSLACMLYLGALPKEDEASLTGMRDVLKAEYAPWLLPCIINSDAIKLLDDNKKLCEAVAMGGTARLNAFAVALSLLLSEVGGHKCLSKMAANATRKMEDLAKQLSPILDTIDALHDSLAEAVHEDCEVHTHLSEDATDAEKEASAKAEQIVREASASGESEEATIERIKQAFASVSPNVKVGIITIDQNGVVSGDLSLAPPDVRDMVQREVERRTASRTVN